MKKLSVIIAVFLISIMSIALSLMVMGFRINTTDSIPVGLYRITNTKNLKNSFVIFCPDDSQAFRIANDRGYIGSGLCPGGYGYLMKKVVAIKDDIISVTSKGVYVNQKIIPFSKPKIKDGINRRLPQCKVLNYQIKEDEVMTMTNQSEWSFDGRYYGPISLGQIKGTMIPIWTNNKLENQHD